jgi:hypothetical protein
MYSTYTSVNSTQAAMTADSTKVSLLFLRPMALSSVLTTGNRLPSYGRAS